ncbi:LysR family transcriptional regulator [Methylobacterium durans]|uniref:LysR family transcriptional regulator n=1 Tax=Methylobacterium durans TaxID=2202825 RepID=UPI002AFF31ED|nr:LysR family transcriptional regulator [Methylobacterium durans]MEA1834764.1 LysR family transcriptional regulator [Methylobacterium durans]
MYKATANLQPTCFRMGARTTMASPQILRDIALFVEVAKRLSFSKAAEALDMPVSSLSRRISQFEAEIGIRLLDRTTRRTVLTAAGETYLAQAARLVEEAARSFDELVAQAKGPTGLLKVAAPPDFWAVQHLSELTAEFAGLNEQVSVHLDLHAEQVDLVQDDYDLAIISEEPKNASLIVRRVGATSNRLFAAPDYLRARGRPVHPQELVAHDIVLPVASRTATWQFTRDDEVIDTTVSGRISCNNRSLARRFAVTGRGITLASDINVQRDVENGRLEPILPEWQLPATPIYIATTSRLLPAKTRSYIDFVSKRLGGVLAEAGKAAQSNRDRSLARRVDSVFSFPGRS